MKEEIFYITTNTRLAPGVFELRLSGDVSEIKRPGQFVNVALDGLFLRRPISVCDWDEERGELRLLCRIVGEGSERLSEMKAGESLNILTGLGNGFDLEAGGEATLLIGGGIGLAPLYGLAKRLGRLGVRCTALLGFNGASDVFYEEEFKALGCEVEVCTMDGSYGSRGSTAELCKSRAADGRYGYFYACGPKGMCLALERSLEPALRGEYSLEERMGCGFGACMGCSLTTKNGPKRVCKEGPVFRREDLIWERI